MADPILFQSANRLLAASPSGDFSMYGAQPAIEVSVSAPAAARGGDTAATTGPSEGALPAPSREPTLHAEATRITDPVDDTSRGSSFSTASAAAPQGETTEPAFGLADTSLNPFDLRPIVLTNLDDRGAGYEPASAGGTGGDAAPGEPLEIAPEFATPVLDDIVPIVGGTIGTAVGIVEPVVDTVTGLVGTTVNTVVGIAEPVLDTVGGVVGDTLTTVTGVADPVLGSVGGTLDSVTGLIGGAADATTPLIATLGEVGHLPDLNDNVPVTDLLGSDPAGGIATLVSLVNVTDLLDLRDVGAPADPNLTVAGDPVGGLLDTLTTDPTDIASHDNPADQPDGAPNPLHDLLGGGTEHHDGGLGLGV